MSTSLAVSFGLDVMRREAFRAVGARDLQTRCLGPRVCGPNPRRAFSNIGARALMITYAVLGVPYIITIWYNGHQDPILIIKAPILQAGEKLKTLVDEFDSKQRIAGNSGQLQP